MLVSLPFGSQVSVSLAVVPEVSLSWIVRQ